MNQKGNLQNVLGTTSPLTITRTLTKTSTMHIPNSKMKENNRDKAFDIYHNQQQKTGRSQSDLLFNFKYNCACANTRTAGCRYDKGAKELKMHTSASTQNLTPAGCLSYSHEFVSLRSSVSGGDDVCACQG